MSKIICQICGTSYPESSTQCPICGCVKPANSSLTIDRNTESTGSYTYVKGGRFSKKNVKKRNSGVHFSDELPPSGANTEKDSGKKRVILIITIAISLVFIFICAYILLNLFRNDPAPSIDSTTESTTSTENTIVEIPCTTLNIEQEIITFNEVGQEEVINVNCLPLNTTDLISFESQDPSIATVDDNGKVIIVAEGNTSIVITCGSLTATCYVEFEVPEPSIEIEVTKFELNRSDFTLFYAGDYHRLYEGEIPVSEITWYSDNEEVAIVEYGRVVAVGEGTTLVHAEYDGTKHSCIVRVSYLDYN